MAAALRVAVVGTGFGLVHAEAFARDPRCRVAAVCGRSLPKAEALAQRFGAHACTDWQDLMQPGAYDLISIAAPAPVQALVAAEALRRGISVFLEKPLAGSLEAARELAQLAAGKRLATAINFEFPELVSFEEAKRALEQGRIGRLRHVSVLWHVETFANKQRLDSWKTEGEAGGGALHLFASHTFYYLEWLLGRIRSLCARVQRSPEDTRAGDTLDTLMLETASGLPVLVQIATDAFAGEGHSLRFFGDQGTLRLSNPGADYARGFTLQLATRDEPAFRTLVSEEAEGRSVGREDGRIAPTARIAARLVDAVSARGSCIPDVHAGLRVQHLLAAAHESEASARRVKITEDEGT